MRIRGQSETEGEEGILPSDQLLWFSANIYLDLGFEHLISQRSVRRLYPFGHRVGNRELTRLLYQQLQRHL